MEMISYWKEPQEIYIDEGLRLIVGFYDHKNMYDGGEKALGIHWGDYPQSRGVLSPCVIPKETRDAVLSGLLHQAVIEGKKVNIESITKAIDFLGT